MRKTFKLRLVVLGILLCLADISSANLAEQIDSIITQKSQQKVDFSIHIVEADSGKVIYSHNPHKALVPASNMKLIVTAAALRYLGPNYDFKTVVAKSGKSIVVLGSGDPLFGDVLNDDRYGREKGWIFNKIRASLKSKNIKHIDDIIVDSSIFDDRRVHPSWPAAQLNRDYACEVCGLNYNGNCIDITTTNIGGKIEVTVEPQTRYVTIINKVRPTNKSRGAVGAYRTNTPNKIILKGRCRKKQGPIAVAVERPAAFFGFLLSEELANANIITQGEFLEKKISDAHSLSVLVDFNTPIKDCLWRCNKDSFGLAAEALLKTIAARRSYDKQNGSWSEGAHLVSRYLTGLGIDPNEFYIDDGSGLSKQNRLSANSITTVLLNLYKKDYWRMYEDSLAIGGVDGTISKYFKENKYKGKIIGKTGFISGVKSFSGICTNSEKNIIFSIISNNANGTTRKAINQIARIIVDYNSI